MSYTVVWVADAEEEIARLWVDAPDRAAIAVAADAIDAALRRDPYGVGESREGRRRILIVSPLAVTYTVKQDDSLVEVTKIWKHQ